MSASQWEATQSGPAPAATSGGLYSFLVASLFVFLVGLVLWPRGVPQQLVKAELGCLIVPLQSGATAPGPALARQRAAAVRKELTSSATIRRAIERVGCKPTGSETVISDCAAAVERVRRQLRVGVIAAGSQRLRICVTLPSRDAAKSVALVDELARQFLANQPTAPRAICDGGQLRRLKWRTDAARHYERKARLDLHTTQQIAATGRGGGGQNKDAARRAKLDRQLAEFSSRLDALLATRTPNHPEVRHLLQQMRQLRQLLDDSAAAPRSEFSVVSAAAHTTADSGAAAVRQASDNAPLGDPRPTGPTSDAAGGDVANLQSQYELAVRQRERAERELWQYVERAKAREGARAPVCQPRWVAVPPGVVRVPTSATSGGQLLVLALLAIGCGSLLVWQTRQLCSGARLRTVEQVQAGLPLPIVGQLPLDAAAPAPPRFALRARALCWIIPACEFGLALLVVIFLLGALADSPLGAELARDPLRTFAETVRKCTGCGS